MQHRKDSLTGNNMNPYLDSIIGKKPDAVYILPFPPSVNHLYFNARGRSKGRRKAKKYKDWELLAENAINSQKIIKFNQPVAIIHNLYKPDFRVRDCANYEKATTDFLVNAGVLVDDVQVRLNVQLWCDWSKEKNKTEICIYSLASCIKECNIDTGIRKLNEIIRNGE